MTLASRDYSEKRNFLRMQVDAPVTIQLPDGSGLSGICKDLSGGGLLVEMENTMNEGTVADVEISSSHGHSPILKASARVTRVETQENEKYLIGMEILTIVDTE